MRYTEEDRKMAKELEELRKSPQLGIAQRKLETELDKLVQAFGHGGNLKVIFLPKLVKRKMGTNIRYVSAELKEDTIFVYRAGCLEDMQQSLAHEYFEYLLDPLQSNLFTASNEIVKELVTAYNRIVRTYGTVFTELNYKDKERIVDTLAAAWFRKQEK